MQIRDPVPYRLLDPRFRVLYVCFPDSGSRNPQPIFLRILSGLKLFSDSDPDSKPDPNPDSKPDSNPGFESGSESWIRI
jgi:hypothetical protein